MAGYKTRKPPMEKAVYSIPEVASLLGVGLPTAYEVAKSEGFPAVFIGKRILVSKDAFERWLATEAAGKRIPSYKMRNASR